MAVNNLHINWVEQAERSARDYLKMEGYSPGELIEQLVCVGFSHAEAMEAVKKISVN